MQLNQLTVSNELETKLPLKPPAIRPESSVQLETWGPKAELPPMCGSFQPSPAPLYSFLSPSPCSPGPLPLCVHTCIQAQAWGCGPCPQGATLKQSKQTQLPLFPLHCPCSPSSPLCFFLIKTRVTGPISTATSKRI